MTGYGPGTRAIRARRGDTVPAGPVRLSAGCEDTADLLADIGAAPDAVVDSAA